MDFRPAVHSIALSLSLRTMLAAIFAFLCLQVLATSPQYATALVLGGLAALTIWDTARRHGVPPAAAEMASPAQRDQARQHDRLLALLDAVTVALIAVAPDGCIAFTNRAARLLIGGEVDALSDIDALGPVTATRILALPAGARQIMTLADGRLMLVWVVGFATPGQPAQKLISLQAVTGDLDAVQLRAWQDMARVLSHEIMNSLTPIASLSESAAELLRGREASEPEVARAVQAIARRSLHLIDFVERYRQVADLPEPRLRPVRASELVAAIGGLLHTEFATRGIAYHSEIGPGDLTVMADAELLSQAILNLLRNAAEAVSATEAATIRLSCEKVGPDFICAVADNGPGIPADRVQEIFLPFFTTKPEGSGIGLSLARQIALAHGGRIEVMDNPGGGALFRMTIPVRDPATIRD
ncbi:sensor histidine kinase [Nitrospirillum iridis]|uniref:histidine kinase n=1 Tax=Nitrospirillum iridis TaxID=765888 RepID=A0A7X0B3J4_9PROT|nr:ATP-binding protein [Nitrospirillum iridis]MBB6255078.1 nitrogen fixation/metabolism regulation signal transduction histidine kinase [Nitrospirillum iridis]